MRTLVAVLCALFMFMIFLYPETASSSAVESLRLWANSLVPALMPYCAAAMLIAKSDVLTRLSLPFKKSFRRRFGLPSCLISLLPLSIISGFPNGARICANMYSNGEIKKDEVAKIINLTSFCSPSFMMLAVAGNMLKCSPVYLIIPHYISAFILILIAKKDHSEDTPIKEYRSSNSSLEIIADSIASSSQAMLSLLGFTVLPSVFSELIIKAVSNFIALSKPFKCLFLGFFEMSSGCAFSATLGTPLSLVFSSFFISFGGLSVICQITYIAANKNIKTQRLFTSKLFQGICSAALTFLLIILFPL